MGTEASALTFVQLCFALLLAVSAVESSSCHASAFDWLMVNVVVLGPDGRFVKNQFRPSGKHSFIVDYTPHVTGNDDSYISSSSYTT